MKQSVSWCLKEGEMNIALVFYGLDWTKYQKKKLQRSQQHIAYFQHLKHPNFIQCIIMAFVYKDTEQTCNNPIPLQPSSKLHKKI